MNEEEFLKQTKLEKICDDLSMFDDLLAYYSADDIPRATINDAGFNIRALVKDLRSLLGLKPDWLS